MRLRAPGIPQARALTQFPGRRIEGLGRSFEAELRWKFDALFSQFGDEEILHELGEAEGAPGDFAFRDVGFGAGDDAAIQVEVFRC